MVAMVDQLTAGKQFLLSRRTSRSRVEEPPMLHWMTQSQGGVATGCYDQMCRCPKLEAMSRRTKFWSPTDITPKLLGLQKCLQIKPMDGSLNTMCCCSYPG